MLKVSLMSLYGKKVSLPYLSPETPLAAGVLSLPCAAVCLRPKSSCQEPTITFTTLCRYFSCLPLSLLAFYGLNFSTFFMMSALTSFYHGGSEMELSESDKNDMMAPECPPITSNGFMLILNMAGNKIGSCVSLEMITLLEDE